MKYSITVFIFCSLLAFYSGCKEETPVSSLDTTNYNTDPETYPVPEIPETSAPANRLVIIRANFSPIGFNYKDVFSVGLGLVKFGNPGQDKGEVSVKLNLEIYPFDKRTRNGSTAYFYLPDASRTSGLPIFDATTKFTFRVSGYSLTDSIIKVPGKLRIDYPVSKTIVPKNKELTVTWFEYSPGDHKAMFVSDLKGKHHFKKVTGNSGTFTAAEMDSLSAGTAKIYILSYNYVLSNNNETVLIGQSVSYSTVTLQ